MKLVGFNFTKISAEKFSDQAQELKVNTSMDVSDIQEIKQSFFKSKEDLVNVKFEYGVKYDPDFVKIELSGNMVLSLESKEAKNLLRAWESKQIPEDFKLTIFNIILKKSSLKALQIEEEFNLPFHIPLPSVKAQKKE